MRQFVDRVADHIYLLQITMQLIRGQGLNDFRQGIVRPGAVGRKHGVARVPTEKPGTGWSADRALNWPLANMPQLPTLAGWWRRLGHSRRTQAMCELVQRRGVLPTAVVAGCDKVAFGALMALKERGLSCLRTSP